MVILTNYSDLTFKSFGFMQEVIFDIIETRHKLTNLDDHPIRASGHQVHKVNAKTTTGFASYANNESLVPS